MTPNVGFRHHLECQTYNRESYRGDINIGALPFKELNGSESYHNPSTDSISNLLGTFTRPIRTFFQVRSVLPIS